MKQHTPQEIITILREVEASPESVADFCRRQSIAEAALYRWRQKYGNLQMDEAKHLTHRPILAYDQGQGQALEAENAKLKKMLAEAMLANEGLKEVLAKKVTSTQRHDLLRHLMDKGLSQRNACRWSGLSRRVAHYRLRQTEQDTQALTVMQPVIKVCVVR